MVAFHDTFASIAEAREAINRYVLNNSKSYQVYKLDLKHYILVCKDKSCSFEIQVQCTKKTSVTITQMKLHTCCLIIYYKNKQASAIWFLKDYYYASVVDNRDITPA